MKKIERFHFVHGQPTVAADGEYVRYNDHALRVEALQETCQIHEKSDEAYRAVCGKLWKALGEGRKFKEGQDCADLILEDLGKTRADRDLLALVVSEHVRTIQQLDYINRDQRENLKALGQSHSALLNELDRRLNPPKPGTPSPGRIVIIYDTGTPRGTQPISGGGGTDGTSRPEPVTPPKTTLEDLLQGLRKLGAELEAQRGGA